MPAAPVFLFLCNVYKLKVRFCEMLQIFLKLKYLGFLIRLIYESFQTECNPHMVNNENLKHLIFRIQDNDRQALSELYSLMKTSVYSLALV